MESFITGYQWGDTGVFIGPYTFPLNLDGEQIHLPPNTTLIKPLDVEIDQEAAWDGANWFSRRLELAFLPDRVIGLSDDPAPVVIPEVTPSGD